MINNVVISVIVPVYNSEETLNELINRLSNVLTNLVQDEYEIILVNDGSHDSSWDLLKDTAEADYHVTAINLTRNFGQHNALLCGFSYAKGKYILTLDDDLQHSPEEIPKLYSEILKGYDVVYGVFQDKKHSKFRNFGSSCTQYVYNKIFNNKIRLSSFRIITREIISNLLSYKKSFTYLDGLISWQTTNIQNIIVSHNYRAHGASGYSFKKLVVLSLNMLTNFSIVPLQIASLTGMVFAITGFFIGIYFIFKKLFLGIPVSGFTSTVVIITIFSGVQLVTVGILGEYIGRIHINVNNRPQYAVRDMINSKENESNV